MTGSHIHPAYCRCPQCQHRHPGAGQIAPTLKASLLAFAIGGAWALVLWLAVTVAHQLTALL
ncbi:hypothetical protein SAMN05518801_10768 [Novosphingobium sp. CF614]|uniref:hypothetical protein n=1 Tax=Novosphingobium sp. CF614 TaxID=1884364 RepID=UPI0008F102F9|nr:hypothetical protein [Novosphingobium sp. CF614]SFG09021.1 hypothetical protein SAMN05518801_10768 [Novosphingobium sp. CF614]